MSSFPGFEPEPPIFCATHKRTFCTVGADDMEDGEE